MGEVAGAGRNCATLSCRSSRVARRAGFGCLRAEASDVIREQDADAASGRSEPQVHTQPLGDGRAQHGGLMCVAGLPAYVASDVTISGNASELPGGSPTPNATNYRGLAL